MLIRDIITIIIFKNSCGSLWKLQVSYLKDHILLKIIWVFLKGKSNMHYKNHYEESFPGYIFVLTMKVKVKCIKYEETGPRQPSYLNGFLIQIQYLGS